MHPIIFVPNSTVKPTVKTMNLSYRLPLVGGAVPGGKRRVSREEIAHIKSFREALILCIELSPVKHTDDSIALELGLKPCLFSRILNRRGKNKQKANFDPDLIGDLENFCLNNAVSVYLAHRNKARLVCDEDMQHLDQELSLLRRMVA